ncbi:precorrin-3B synthase [Microvirga rosea]|uniref:precorrin-3B synthase n=1 Tax=Microvirga rosea TaxID=2715425 RepID=UPI001D0B6D37|nr:precorrin-3B synthase [Microvirga rosea]MCB8820786.1 precorrin-3B synthase [Microvirga rosea]
MIDPTSPLRRGWCPGVRRPMATGDGLLVRIHPQAGRLTTGQTRLIAQAAQQYGNGHLDVTARGNLQIRGVREETYAPLATLLDREGLVEPEGSGPNRLAVVSPLAGLDPRDRFDTLKLAQAIEHQVGISDGLPPKLFIAVDGGGSMPLEAIGADLLLLAHGEAVAFGVTTTQGTRWIGASSLSFAPEAARLILSTYAQMWAMGRTAVRRLRDLPPDLLRELASIAELKATSAPNARPPVPPAGLLGIEGGHQAVLLALPFGRCTSGQLEQVARWSERYDTREIRLSFTRGILLPGIADADLAILRDEARNAGFITDAYDHRLSLFACPGKPECKSAVSHAPTDALRIAGACGPLLARGASLHVSGCSKGCAHPSSATLTLVGRDGGGYDIVLNGSSQDAASCHLSIEELMRRLLPLDGSDDLRRALLGSAP